MEGAITCADAAAFEDWLERHHDSAAEVWVKIAKKGSGVPSMTASEAVDVVLCFGWIDGQRKSLDGTYFLQRYTRRRPKGTWSRINVDRVAALTAAGRMRAPGLAEVAAARADGRWEAAYESQRTATVPADLAAALAASPRAREAYERLDRTARYLVILGLAKTRTPAGRAARLAKEIAALER
ncbi:YdeI/OmpD-associated family protein [Phytohabitans rumicis]|uniref:OmdA domain containing protein n=1 Tax=Phytohabitans rumicis TaxID=1076125 RepID=A0A6V8LM87_9ACTN|nr:YdeI/OmpD-associated family protein [Phytohabitans rumicis]GFJ95719.1 hypothetical protein Prum_093610 [Phytohabitans rumicis]